MAVNRAARVAVNRAARVAIKSIPPPVGGLNTRDSVANMAPTDALILDNYDPGTADTPLRAGYAPWASGITGQVETLAVYNSGTQQRMFAVADGKLYDVTKNMAVRAPLVSDLTNSRWQWVNFANAGKHFLVMVNGADEPMLYDGTAWSRIGNGTGARIVSIMPTFVAMVRTSAAHELKPGAVVVLSGVTPTAFNGTYSIVVVDAYTFAYGVSANHGSQASAAGSYTSDGKPGAPIATITMRYNGIVTTATAHGLAKKATVQVANTTPRQYSGTFTIGVISATQFSYVLASAPDGNVGASLVGEYGTSDGTIWGVDSTTLVHVNVFGNRLWFTQQHSLVACYLDLYAIGGRAYPFDLGAQFVQGGYLMGIASWNIDNTAGLNEYILFVSSQGEVVVYRGSDPTQAATFSISAKFRIGPPVGRRFFEKLGSDIVLLGADGLVPLSKALLTDRSQAALAVSAKIQPSISLDIIAYGHNFGWQPVLYPNGNKVLVNVPVSEDLESRQYVMSTITSAWARVTGWNAFCFCYFEKNLFFGGADMIGEAYVGQDDGGIAINSDIQPAYNYFDRRGVIKSFKMLRPIFITSDAFSPQVDLNVDYDGALPTSTPELSFGNSTPWDKTPWDSVPWGGSSYISRAWIGLSGQGYAATVRMRAQTKGISFAIESFDFMFEPQKTPTF